MWNSIHPSSFAVRGASVSVAALLLGVVACSSTPDPAGGNASAGAPSAGAANPGGSTAGSANGTAGAANGTAGSANGTAGSANGTAGSANGTAGSANGTAGSANGTAGMGNSGGTTGSGGGGDKGGGANGGSDGNATGCSGFKLCDDFEGDAPGKGTSVWKVTGGSAVTVVTDQHNSGMHSVHIAAPNTGGFSANIQETKTFPAADFWGRAFLRFKAGAGGHQMYIAVNLSGDQLRLLNRLGSDNAQVNFQKTDKFYDTGFKIPQEQWFCYEWHVTASAVSISIDGMARNVTVPGITGGTSLSLGFQRYAQGGGDGELWIDDVAVNDTQIGCK